MTQAVLRTDLSSFIAKCFATVVPGTSYLPNWHIDLLADHLLAVERGELPRLIINMPPRCLKSLSITIAWTAWLLGHVPSRRIITASYARSLSTRHALDTRLILESDWYRALFPDFAIADGQNEKHRITTTQQGGRLATSVGGALTGEGGDVLIADDPLNPRQAHSEIQREAAYDWLRQTFMSRLDDPARGAVVLVMQRLHADDVTGRLLEVDAEGWARVELPLIAERPLKIGCVGTPYEMSKGQVLHSERFPDKIIARMRQEFGSHIFQAQYQQRPVPSEGGMILRVWLRHGDAPENPAILQSWDTAIKAGKGRDETVCLTFAMAKDALYLLDCAHGQWLYPELKQMLFSQAEQWEPTAILIEDKASGQSLLQDARHSTLPLIPVMPTQDKVTRLAQVSALIEAGRLILPRRAAWLAAFEDQLLRFPQAPHDDMVDALSQALYWWQCRARRSVPEMRSF